MLGRWTGLLVAFAAALAAVGFAYYRNESGQIHRERYEAIAAIGTLKADQLHSWRQVRLDHAEALSRAPSVARDLVTRQGRPGADLGGARLVLTRTARRSAWWAAFRTLPPRGPPSRIGWPRTNAISASVMR